MKKLILGISFLMMAAFAGTAGAQCVKENCPDKTKCATEQCAKKDCKAKDCKVKDCDKRDCDKSKCDKRDCDKSKCDKKGKCDKGFECKMPARDGKGNFGKGACPFEGLNLTDAQIEQVKDLDNALKASRKEMMDAAKASGTKLSLDERRQNDISLRTKYLSDLKNILSPEQYTEFLQNFYVNQFQNPAAKITQERMEKKIEKIQKARIEKLNNSKEK
ncbi:MAG: Spy/CpxP family protein refolding chaperone [Muribaculaceae bacterium]|nr:Spy/CpxP family protein refolding chaperone [Muribaculaceae bacterium]